MRLVNMDVDRYGTNDRCQLGPFSPGLNAVCGPKGSGKTTLLNWLRTIAEESLGGAYSRPDPAWNHAKSPMSGILEFQNRGYQFRATSDRNGRVELSSRPVRHRDDWHVANGHANRTTQLSAVQKDAFAGLASASGATDTEASLEQLAQRLGLNHVEIQDGEKEQLLARERSIRSQLASMDRLQHTQATLLARKQQLEEELRSVTHGQGLRYEGLPIEHRRLDERYSAIELDLQTTLQQIEQLDRSIADKQAEMKLLDHSSVAVSVGASYREQLKKLDERLNRWRQTLRDLKTHRETIEHDATDARLDKQIGDQLSVTKDSDPRAAMRSLEAQILSTRQQLDVLVQRYTTVPGYDYRSASAAVAGTGYHYPEATASHGVYRDASGRTYVGSANYLPESSALPETLRAMQKDLHEVCQQLARHEANNATETLRQQSQQLKRCETELLQSVEKLIEERAALLRRIANEHHLSVEQLTLAFGNWCQCHDHPHLHDWLLSEEAGRPTQQHGSDPVANQRLIEELETLKQARKQASLHVDDCRRQIRDADLHRHGILARKPQPVGRHEADVRRDLDQVLAQLHALENRDRLEAELQDIVRHLQATPVRATRESRFRDQVNRHVASLMPTSTHQLYGRNGSLHGDDYRGRYDQVRYDLVDGIVIDQQAPVASDYRLEVPAAIVRVAMRIAIGEMMSARGEAIPVVIDQSLDAIAPEIQRTAVAHLSSVARAGQQIVVMTSDENICELVRAQHGWVGYMHSRPATAYDPDVNRHLAALANEDEAEKWYHPVSKPERAGAVREYYLTERSLIEDLPSIDPAAAARARAVGIDRIGDLLDVDPQWLADNVRMDGIRHQTIATWQAEASLLCSVRNLRPFDARVLVGAGISTPKQLAEMHPSHLLDRVERFLATDRGRRILSSGNSYELSRITSWIASAKGGAGRYNRTSVPSHARGAYESASNRSDSDRGDRDYSNRTRNGYSRNGNSYNRDYDSNRDANGRSRDYNYERSADDGYSNNEYDSDGNRSSSRSGYSSSNRSSNRSRRSSSSNGYRRSKRSYPVVDRDGHTRNWEDREPRAPRERSRQEREERDSESRTRTRSARMGDEQRDDSNDSETRLKFYLELSSPVVDAPSIGPRMASKLEALGIHTVDQLLAANADSLADKLNHRRVDGDTIRAWQEQARLVCRIPNLRGHDAQMLVACDMTSPEALATMDPGTVLAQVAQFAESKEGQRVLRGSKEPDLEEVTDWISWAASCRSLNAA